MYCGVTVMQTTSGVGESACVPVAQETKAGEDFFNGIEISIPGVMSLRAWLQAVGSDENRDVC